jgi:hypothetical protein
MSEDEQYEIEYATWQRAALHYQQEQARKAMKAMQRPKDLAAFVKHLAENPPPIPPPLIVSRKHIAWLDSLCQVDLSGLDQINQGGQAHDERSPNRKRSDHGGHRGHA